MFHWFFVNAPAQFKHSIIVLQMNCAHLENFLHEAREEAQTHLCAADRRASEYSALRASAIKTHSLFERLRSCVSSAGMVAFADSLRALSQSLAKYVYCIVLFLFVVIFHYISFIMSIMFGNFTEYAIYCEVTNFHKLPDVFFGW